MKTLGLILLFLSLSTHAAALKPGQCLSDIDSKNYLPSVRESKSQLYKDMVQEIGPDFFASLQDTPTEHYFFCRVSCADKSGGISQIWLTLADSPSRFSQMDGFLCPGITIENVIIPGTSLRNLKPIASPFNAYDTNLPELHKWLKRSQFSLRLTDSAISRARFKSAMEIVIGAYLSSSSSVLHRAAAELWEISNRSEIGELMLANLLKKYAEINWVMSTDYSNPEFIIFQNLKTHGRFLQYENPLPDQQSHDNPVDYEAVAPI